MTHTARPRRTAPNAVLLAVAMAASACAPVPAHAQAPTTAPGTAPDFATTERRIVEHGNAFRAAQGLPPVRPDPVLTQAARDFAAFMARTDRYGHEADGREPADRVQAAGYAYCLVAENIAYRFDSRGFTPQALARGFADGWIESPPHRKNLLEPAATDTGVAVARSPRTGRHYGVQLFARPAAMQVRFELHNAGRTPLRYTLDDQRYSLAPGAGRWHERCITGTVALEAPRGNAAPARGTLEPQNGRAYQVSLAEGGLRIVPTAMRMEGGARR